MPPARKNPDHRQNAPWRASAARTITQALVLALAAVPVSTLAQTVEDEEPALRVVNEEADAAPLPAADEEETEAAAPGTRAESIGLRVQPVQAAGTSNPRRTPAAEQLNRRDDPDPFTPSGIRTGSLILRPSLVQQIAHERENDGETSTSRSLLRTVIGARIESDWDRHRLDIDLEQVIDETISGAGEEAPSTAIGGALRLDLSPVTTANLRLGYARTREDQDDVSGADIAEDVEAAVERLTGSAALNRSFGNWRGTATLDAHRVTYGDAVLADGTNETLDDRDETGYALTIRAGADNGAVLRPFVEGSFTRAVRDSRIDSLGFARSSKTYGLRAGAAVDRGEKFNGEVAIGYALRDIADSRLESIRAITVDGTIDWSPRRGTDIRFGLSTNLEDGTAADEPGAAYYLASAGIARRFRPNASAGIGGFAGRRTYAGATADETAVGASASLTWFVNRAAGIEGRIEYEKTTGDDGIESDTLTVAVGVRAQR